jgi:hypothetical protein
MRRLVAALLVALLAFTLVGCGGGGEEEAAAPPADQAAAPPPAPVDPAVVVPVADRSAATSETFEPFPTGDAVPAPVLERLKTKQAMLLFFYNSGQDVTDDVRDQIDTVVADNQGLIDLITYDLGKSTSVNEVGQVVVDEGKLSEDESGQQAVHFAKTVGVDHTPYIIIVDEQGYQIFWARGFIDAESLERQVQRAAQ